MASDTDVLGKAVSVNLRGLRDDELSAAIEAIQKVVGTSFMVCVIQSGLLSLRHQITVEKWEALIKSSEKAIATVPPPPKPSPIPSPPSKSPSLRSPQPMDVDETSPSPKDSKPPKTIKKEPIIFQPFDDNYTPKDLVSQIYPYLDYKSHGALETCNKRLLIISRNPSSNLFLGYRFDRNSSKCSTAQWVGTVKEADPLHYIMEKTHRFKHLKRLCVYNTDSSKWRKAMYCLLKACGRHVEEFVICGGSTKDWRDDLEESLHSKDLLPLPKLKKLRCDTSPTLYPSLSTHKKIIGYKWQVVPTFHG